MIPHRKTGIEMKLKFDKTLERSYWHITKLKWILALLLNARIYPIAAVFDRTISFSAWDLTSTFLLEVIINRFSTPEQILQHSWLTKTSTPDEYIESDSSELVLLLFDPNTINESRKKTRQVRIYTRYEFVLIVGHFYLTIKHFNYVPNVIVI